MASRTRRFTQAPRGSCLEMSADDRSSPNASRPHPWPCRVSPWSNDENGQAPYSLRPRITGPGLEWLRDGKIVRAVGRGGDKFFGGAPSPPSSRRKPGPRYPKRDGPFRRGPDARRDDVGLLLRAGISAKYAAPCNRQLVTHISFVSFIAFKYIYRLDRQDEGGPT